MKVLIFNLVIGLLALLLSCLPIYAVEKNCVQIENATMEEDDDERDIPLYILGSKDVTLFSLFQPTVYATLSNNIVSVDLSELPEGATVTITRMATGEEIYSQTDMGSMEIDLNACGKGQYQIDVVSGGLWLQGCFIVS